MLETMQGLPAHGCDLSFGHDVVRDDICKTASFHVLHDHPQHSGYKIAIHKIDNVLVLALLHDENFVDNEILLGLLLQIHLLDGDAAGGRTFGSGKDAARCALADLP